MAYWFDGIGRETAEQNFVRGGQPAHANRRPAGDRRQRRDASQSDRLQRPRRGHGRRSTRWATSTRTTCDDDGRTIETIQNYSSTTISTATNITTDYGFNAGTNLLDAMSVTTENPDCSGTETQITAYVYGSDTGLAGAAIHRGDLVRAVITGISDSSQLPLLVYDISQGYTSGLDVVEYTYNCQGEVATMTDQEGTTHQYTRDQLGWQVSDTVTALAGYIDGGVRRIDTAYNFQGSVALTTSYSTTTANPEDVVNQVADGYNGFGLLTEEQQSVSGEVTSSTPAVYYGYSTDPVTPTLLTSMTYPNGRVLTYGYNTGADAAVGRVSYLADSDSTVLAQYKYLGLDQIDDVSNPQPGIDLNLGHKGSNGQLDCVDQFNRATDMVFAETGGNVDQIMQGYDVSGNEVWQAQPTAAGYGVYLDKFETYNPLNELTGVAEGTLNSAHTAITSNEDESESFALDGMGNWSNYTQTVGGSTVVDQDRQTNGLNEIRITTTLDNSTSNWAVPVYDCRPGNMTTMPQPGNETSGLRLRVRCLEPFGGGLQRLASRGFLLV